MPSQYEYRVIAGYYWGGRETLVDRPENPFPDRESAETFAASFEPPKFSRAWVERRRIGRWTKLNALGR